MAEQDQIRVRLSYGHLINTGCALSRPISSITCIDHGLSIDGLCQDPCTMYIGKRGEPAWAWVAGHAHARPRAQVGHALVPLHAGLVSPGLLPARAYRLRASVGCAWPTG